MSRVETMVKVFRVEDANGIGPYHESRYANGVKRRMHLAHRVCPDHPYPYGDGINEVDIVNDICGFDSMGACRSWFGDFLQKLIDEAGYEVVEYLVPNSCVRRGYRQLVFDGRLKKEKKVILTCASTSQTALTKK